MPKGSDISPGGTLPLLGTDSRAIQEALAKKLAADEAAKAKAKARADKAAAAKLLTKETRARAVEAAIVAAAVAAKDVAPPALTLQQTLETYRAELEPTLVAIVSGARRGDGSSIDTESFAHAVVERMVEVDILEPLQIGSDNIIEELRRCAEILDRPSKVTGALETFAAFIENSDSETAKRLTRMEETLSQVASSNRTILYK